MVFTVTNFSEELSRITAHVYMQSQNVLHMSITCSYNDTVSQAEVVTIHFQIFDTFLRQMLCIHQKLLS